MIKLIINRAKNLSPLDLEDSSVSEAIYTIYKNDEEWMLNLDWNGHIIRLDGIMISQIYSDIVQMLVKSEEGTESFKIFFLDTAFTAEWRFTLAKETIKIEAIWTTAEGFHKGEYMDTLRKDNIVTVNKTDFINDWHHLLKIIKKDLLKAGYNNQLEGFEYLEKLLD